jgi:hypothetical protein
MIKTYLSSVSKAKSLTVQIRDAEKQVLNSQQRVGIRTATLIRNIHQQMTAPASLLLAGGLGFILGELTTRKNLNSCGTADKSRTSETTPLRTALNLLTSVHTLYTALPIAWIVKSFYQPGSSDRQATERQARPAAAGNCGRSSQ